MTGPPWRGNTAFFFAFAIALLSATNATAVGPCKDDCPAEDNECLYRSAICEAAVFEATDARKLTPIQQFPAEVVTWTRFPNTFPVGEKVKLTFGDLFVTVAPEVQNLCKNFPKDKLDLRIRQLLGLPPPEEVEPPRFFVTFKVNRKRQIFRPCIDPDVTTIGPCTFEVADDKPPVLVPDRVKKRRHAIWLLRFAFNNSWKIPDGFPFTRLGYTYDWNPENEDHVGVSEYVLPRGRRFEVLSNLPTDDYCS